MGSFSLVPKKPIYFVIHISKLCIKVQLFWEGHKDLELSSTWFDIHSENIKLSGKHLCPSHKSWTLQKRNVQLEQKKRTQGLKMNYTKVQKIILMFIQNILSTSDHLIDHLKKNIYIYSYLRSDNRDLRVLLSKALIKRQAKGTFWKILSWTHFWHFYWWTWITNLLESENTTRLSSPWCCFNNWDRRLLLHRWEELFSVELVALLLPSGVVFLDIFVEPSPMKNKIVCTYWKLPKDVRNLNKVNCKVFVWQIKKNRHYCCPLALYS